MPTILPHQTRALQEKINFLAQENEIEIEFDKGNRENDILVMSLNTEKDNALEFYLRVSQEFPQYSVDVFHLGNPDRRGLMAALIEPYTLEKTHPFYEKRRKPYFVTEDTVDNWETFLDEINPVITYQEQNSELPLNLGCHL